MEDKKLKGEQEILTRFIQVYCNGNHGTKKRQLCPECSNLLGYAKGRLDHCPYDPKPMCKKCPTHCYKPEMRKKIREVMRYSGIHFVKRGRLDWLVKYFLQSTG